MGKRSFKPGAVLGPLPAVMVSCGNEKECNIITIAWTGIINSDPPMTYISVRKSRYSHKIIKESGVFVINLTTEELAFATDYCGVKSGSKVDKFKEQRLTSIDSEKIDCPAIKESPVNLECIVKEVHEYPSHDMFVAEIVNVRVDEKIISSRDKIELEKVGLLAYSHGEYFGIKRTSLGRFGFSVMKKKTKKRLEKEKRATGR